MAAPIAFLLPLFASIIQGAIGHGLAANEASKRRNEEIMMAQKRREALQPIIDQLSEGRDWFNSEEQLVRDFTRASDQMAAQAAQTGMTNAGSGGLDNVRRDVLGSMIAELADRKMQDETQRQAMIAQLLNDPSLYASELTPGNVGMNTFWGSLLGSATGAASNLTGYLGTPEGMNFLQGALGVNQAAGAPAGDPRFGVTYNPPPLLAGQSVGANVGVRSAAPAQFGVNPSLGAGGAGRQFMNVGLLGGSGRGGGGGQNAYYAP